MNKKGLGKGLEALIPQLSVDDSDSVAQIPIRELRANPYQPRTFFDDERLDDLARSIEEHGIIQPLIVRKSSVKGYEIVAGERRFRAAQRAGLLVVPAVVRMFSDVELMEIAIIENLQREDLNAIEVAEAYANLMDKTDVTQEQLAHRVGQSRSHVANMLRLLQLPSVVRELVSRGTLSMGHARALLAVSEPAEQIRLAQRVADEDLSVRKLESLVYAPKKIVSRETNQEPVKYKEYEDKIRTYLGTAVTIRAGKKRGKIEIEYYSDDDFERILTLLTTK